MQVSAGKEPYVSSFLQLTGLILVLKIFPSQTYMKNIAIILSGGIGSRMGSETPKQYIEIGGKPVITYCLEQFANHRRIDAVIIALAMEWRSFVSDLLVVKTAVLFHIFTVFVVFLFVIGY